MRNILLLFFLFFSFLITNSIYAQIPNAGFEEWSDEFTPVNWRTGNFSSVNPVSRVSEPYSGNYALKGEVVDFSGFAFPPALQAGEEYGFPFNQRAGYFTGQYKFAPVEGDVIIIAGYLYDNDEEIAYAAAYINQPSSSYTQFSVPFYYFSSSTPDSADIFITIASSDTLSGFPHIGSVFIMDDLAFSGEPATGVDDDNAANKLSFMLEQNYPNPFNPATTIKYQIPELSFVTLKVFNINGEEIAVLQNGQLPAGSHEVKFDASNLPSGFYFYRIQAGQYSEVRKMILLK